MANVRYKDHTLLTGGLAAGDVFPIDELVSGSTYQTRRATAAMVATYVEAGLTAIYQPLDADLTAIAALTPANDDLIQRKAGAWTNRTIAQVKTDFGLAAIATSGSASDLGAGTVPLARLAGITTAELSATAGITNSQLAGSIVYGKLTLTDSIVNADINSAAAIAYSKLNLTGAILNADLAGSIANAKLANSSITIGSTSVSLGATAATIAGLTLTAPTINGGTATALTGIGIRSTGAAFDLTIASTEVFTAGRTLTIAMGDAARTLTLGGDATLNGGTHSGTNTGDQTITLSGDVSGSGTGAITTAIGATKVTSAMLNADVYSTAHSWGGQQTFTAPILGTPASGTLTNATGLPPVTGIVGWPANASGVLTNNGSGTLSWGAAGGGLTVGTTAIASGTATRLLYETAGNVLGEISGATSDGTNITFGSGNLIATSAALTTPAVTTSGTVTRTAVGVTSADGWILTNTTAAAAGAQQYSPRLRLTGQGWKTNATAASQTVDWIVENQPVQGTTAPTSNFALSAQVNAGGYTPRLTVSSNGLTTFSPVTSASNMAMLINGQGGSVYAGGYFSLFVLAPAENGTGAGARMGPGDIALPSNAVIGFASSTTGAIGASSDVSFVRQASAVFRIANGGTNNSTGAGSLVLGTSTVGSIGTSGVGVLAIANGTAPSSSPADEFQLYSADWNGAGTAAAHFRNEEGHIIKICSQAVAAITNNVTAGGTTDQVDTWSDLTVYATDAAAIRNAIYQLSRKLAEVVTAQRANGLFR